MELFEVDVEIITKTVYTLEFEGMTYIAEEWFNQNNEPIHNSIKTKFGEPLMDADSCALIWDFIGDRAS